MKNFTNSWNNGRAFAALIHHHRPDIVDMDKFNGSSLLNLESIFDIANEALSVPKLIDADDIADVPRPDERVIIPYVAFLFKIFASYQKTAALVKSVKKALVSAASTRWILQYEGKAKELKEWMEKMSKHFDSVGDPTDWDDLNQIRAALESFAQYRKAEKPTRRKSLPNSGVT